MSELPLPSLSGLLTAEDAPVPLAGVVVEAEISAFCARTVVTQRFVNRESTPIEAVYVFPLEEGAAVCGFEAIVDGTLVVGEVKDRDEAFASYDEAIEKGHGAFLLDEERPDVFQASVGNLPPGKEVLLRLTYVTELTVHDNGLRFTIPTTVSPRFAPAEDHSGLGRPDSEALNPPVAWRVPYGLNLTVRLAMTGEISRVESPSHPVSVATSGAKATVTLSQRDAALDRDFVLTVEACGLDAPRAWIEAGDNRDGAVAIGFVPRLTTGQVPGEVIFLVDRSGSMDGTSIEEVRNALQLCLRSMIPGCRFNIIGFGSTFEPLFDKSMEYGDDSLGKASAHVATLNADLGGTEILPALKAALEQPRASHLPRQIVVLTDGEVTNTDAVIALAKQHAAGARIFTFGIGAGASHHLVGGLARAGGGTSEFIFPGERIEPKVVRQFGRLLSPALTNVSIDWGGLDATAATSAPPVFAGGRLVSYAFLKDSTRAQGTSTVVRLTAEGPTGPVAFEIPVDPAVCTRGTTIATLAARARIRALEESPEWIAGRGSRQRGRKANRVSQEIIELGTRYGLASRETSWVAIERRETPIPGDMRLRRVPIALTTGWGGVDRIHLSGVLTSHRPSPAMPGRVFTSFGALSDQAGYMPVRAHADGRFAPARSETMNSIVESAAVQPLTARRWRPPTASVPAPPAAMQALIALQGADGSWDLTAALAGIIGHEVPRLESALRAASGDPNQVRRAWATALALVWLQQHAAGVAGEWRLLGDKAQRWLDDTTAIAPGGFTWTSAAREFFEGRPAIRA